MQASKAFLCALLLVSSTTALAYDWKQEFEAGQQGQVRFRDGSVRKNRLYLFAKEELTYDLGRKGRASNLVLTGSVRGWTGSTYDPAEIDPRTISVAWSIQKFRLEAGFQEIPWGETFGFFIADIVNPRDLRDPLFNEMSWVRLPVFALNGQYFLDRWTFQAVFTPFPRNNMWPGTTPDGTVPVAEPTAFDGAAVGHNAEWGGRASYLFESGFDVGLFYFNHWNRNAAFNPAFDPSLNPSGPVFRPAQERVQSWGLTASEALGVFVFRADSVLNVGQPLNSLAPGRPLSATQWQTIVGTDLSWGGDLTAGLQLHNDSYVGGFTGVPGNQAVSLMAQKKWADEKFVTEAFLYKGFNTRDFWFQPKVTWNVTPAGAISIRGDWVAGSTDPNSGSLPLLRDEDRLMTWISYRF